MASGSMAVHGCCLLAVLTVLFAVQIPPAYAQCNTTLLQAVGLYAELSQLAQVIQAAGLNDRINQTHNVTVLAPTNAAFDALFTGLAPQNVTLANLTHEESPGESNRAVSIILYHILPDSLAESQLLNGETVFTSLPDYNLTVSKINPTSTTTTVTFVGNANNATVVTPDVSVCGSVVHIVDRVLLPSATLSGIPYSNEYTPTPSGPAPGAQGSGASSECIGTGAVALWAALVAGALIHAS